MKNHNIFFLLTYAICSFPALSYTEHFNNRSQDELQSINREIESLQEKLASMRQTAVYNEIHAQPYMIDNWHEFAQDIQTTEENEKAILAIKNKIKQLNDDKEVILKRPPSK